jgi:hypothetical protein
MDLLFIAYFSSIIFIPIPPSQMTTTVQVVSPTEEKKLNLVSLVSTLYLIQGGSG